MAAIPRYRRATGPALFSAGFRPFFLLGALWAAVAILIWLPAFAGEYELPTIFSPVIWHVHEMVFGYGAGAHVFATERGGPMAPKSFHALIARLGERAKMPFPVHPHMLRHACGYALANAGHDTRALQAWLGHRNIQHTVRYSELAPDRFRNFWRS
jgi:integrase